MKINFKLDYKTILPLILKRFSLVLWIFLGLIILAEAFTIKSSVNKILEANAEQVTNLSQLLRVNFATYSAIDKRLTTNSAFAPADSSGVDPFGIVAKKE